MIKDREGKISVLFFFSVIGKEPVIGLYFARRAMDENGFGF